MKVLSRDIYILVIYRPPSSSGISSMNIFMEEFSSCLEHYIIKPGSLIIAGDFNFHFDKTSDAATVNFLSLLEAFNLRQHVNQVTHRAGHTLDLIITRNDDDGFLQSVNVHDSSISDHFTVMCSLNIRKPCFQKKVVSSRKLKSIDFDALKSCIERSALLSHDLTDISQGVDLYNSELSRILDCHAPLATRVVTIRPAAPWYNDEIKIEKKRRRQLERRWRASGLLSDRRRFTEQCSRTRYYSKVVDENLISFLALSASCFIGHLMCFTRRILLQKSYSVARRFVTFFSNKISTIHQDLLQRCPNDAGYVVDAPISSCILAHFDNG